MSSRAPLVLDGVHVPVATPFSPSGDLLAEDLSLIVEHVLGAGCRGIVSAGTTGEYYALSHAERVTVFETTMRLAAGRALMTAGCNAGSTSEVIDFAQAARDLGYDAVMLAAPATSLPRQHELAEHFVAVADAGGLPVILYNYPARAGVEIGFECLDAVASHPGIVAMKESSGDFSRFLALQRRYGSSIEIMCGSDDQAADYFSWGVRSWLAGTANVLPRLHVAIVEAANGGDHRTAHEIFSRILPWVQHMEEGQYNQKVKLGLRMQGIELGPVRRPLLALRPSDEEVSRGFIADALAVDALV